MRPCSQRCCPRICGCAQRPRRECASWHAHRRALGTDRFNAHSHPPPRRRRLRQRRKRARLCPRSRNPHAGSRSRQHSASTVQCLSPLRHDVARWFRRVLGGRDGCGCGRRRAAAIPWCGLSHGYKQAVSMADQCTHRWGDQRARRLCAAALCDRYDASFEPPAQGDARRLDAVLGGQRFANNGFSL